MTTKPQLERLIAEGLKVEEIVAATGLSYATVEYRLINYWPECHGRIIKIRKLVWYQLLTELDTLRRDAGRP